MSKVLVTGALIAIVLKAQPAGEIKQRELTVVRTGKLSDLNTPPRVPRGFAVVIGVSRYLNLSDEDNLKFAEKDAENLYSVLISKEGGGFAFQDVAKLIGKDATLENIRNKLEVWLPSQAQPADRVVVFYVGHGLVDEKRRGYLAPYDLNPRLVEATGYPMDRLGKVLSQDVKARWKLLLTDACHSGKITVESTIENVNESVRGLPEGFLALTSSRASEQSFEDPGLAGGNGVFSYFLARGWLGEADVDPRDGVVTADELVTYVKREVQAYVRERGSKQTPMEIGDFPDDLILGYSPDRRGQVAKQAGEAANGTVIFEVNLDRVEIFVDQVRLGTASPAAPLTIPGLTPGRHEVQGVRLGYDPVSLEILVSPGGSRTVTLRLLHQRSVKPAAKAAYEDGMSIWNRSNSTPQDLKRAASRFEEAIKEDGSFSDASLALCRVLQMQDKSREALRHCRKAVDLDGGVVEARAMTGVLLMETGDYDAAVRQLQAATMQDEKDSFVHSLLAEALFLADRPRESEAEAAHAIALDSSSAQAFLLRGEARRTQSRFAEAEEDYRESLRVQEFSSGKLRVAAYWVVGSGMRKNRSGRQALYRSQAASAHFGLCACAVGRGDYGKAVRDCNRVLALDNDDTDARLLQAQAYASLFSDSQRREYLIKAKESIEASLRINPNLVNAPELRGKLREIRDLLEVIR